MDIKVSKAQLSETIQSGGFLGKLGKEKQMKFALAKESLPQSATRAASPVIDNFERAVRAEK